MKSLTATFFAVLPSIALGQARDTVARPPLPPATKLEAFVAEAGRLTTVGTETLGRIGGGFASEPVVVAVREIRSQSGIVIRGMVVDVTESQYRSTRSFVDADEIDELVRGMDALLDLRANPTPLARFEISYTTKGELELTAYNDPSIKTQTAPSGEIRFAVEAGRVVTATRVGIAANDFRKLRDLVAAANERLKAISREPR
jgi:hypothetical protein